MHEASLLTVQKGASTARKYGMYAILLKIYLLQLNTDTVNKYPPPLKNLVCKSRVKIE